MEATSPFRLTNRQCDFFSDETLLLLLERSDKLASSSLDLLQKSSDRAYTLFGFIITIFSGTAAYLIECHNIKILTLGYTLLLGMGIASVIMFVNVIKVHSFKQVGNRPRDFITDKLIDSYQEDDRYRHMLLIAAIEENQMCYDYNAHVLKERAAAVRRAMYVIKATILVVAFISVILKLFL